MDKDDGYHLIKVLDIGNTAVKQNVLNNVDCMAITSLETEQVNSFYHEVDDADDEVDHGTFSLTSTCLTADHMVVGSNPSISTILNVD